MITDFKLCEDCVMGKTQRVSFGSAHHVTKNKLDYVHSDLWRSPNVPNSLRKSQYTSHLQMTSHKSMDILPEVQRRSFQKFCKLEANG